MHISASVAGGWGSQACRVLWFLFLMYPINCLIPVAAEIPNPEMAQVETNNNKKKSFRLCPALCLIYTDPAERDKRADVAPYLDSHNESESRRLDKY